MNDFPEGVKTQDEWSVLYARMRTPVYARIKAAADADDRAITKWVEIHFREYFERLDACDSNSSSPDTSSASSDSDS